MNAVTPRGFEDGGLTPWGGGGVGAAQVDQNTGVSPVNCITSSFIAGDKRGPQRHAVFSSRGPGLCSGPLVT